MSTSVEGLYRNGTVGLLAPDSDADGSRVVITGIQPGTSVDLKERGIDDIQATDLRRRLATFTEDWDRPRWLHMTNCRKGDVVLVCKPPTLTGLQ